MIYLDNAATTFPKPEKVYLAMDIANRTIAVNAGRGSYELARKASELIRETKTMLRDIVSTDYSSPVVFAPSATIAMNQVINGVKIPENSTVYVSPYEHNSVARTIHSIAKSKGINVKLLPVNTETMAIDLEMMSYEFSKEKPALVICTHVSNVTGYILPIKEIFSEAKKYNCINVLDSAQSLGLVDINSRELNVDIIVFAGHKTLYGPFGIGGFINNTKVPLDTFIVGGTGSDSLNLDMPSDLESRYEAASSNIVAIAGLNAALCEINIKESFEKEKIITEYLIEQLQQIEDIKLHLPGDLSKHIGIVSFSSSKINSEEIGMLLDEDFGIAVRTGYHCAPYIHKFLDDVKSLGTVRVGIGQFNERKDIDSLVKALEDILNE